MAHRGVIAAEVFGQNDRPFGLREQFRQAIQSGRIGAHARGHACDVGRWQADLAVERVFLELGVVAQVHRALRLGHRNPIAARERGGNAVDGRWLIVPLGVVAYGVALDVGGVDPVDPRAAFGLVHRARCAQNQDRRAVDVRVVDGHARVQQADHVVDDGRHGPLARLGEPVGHADGDLLVLAQDHLGHDVATVVDERIVQPAIAGARIQRRVRNLELLEQIDHDVRAIPPIGWPRSGRQLPQRRRVGIQRNDPLSHPGNGI